MSLVASLLLTAGWTLNVVAISVCNFVSTSSGLDNNEQLLYAMGFYTVQGRDGICYVVNWNDWSQNIPYWTNTAMTTARICGGVAALIGFIAMIFGWFLPCFGGGGRCIRITIAVCALISCILVCLCCMISVISVVFARHGRLLLLFVRRLTLSFLLYCTSIGRIHVYV